MRTWVRTCQECLRKQEDWEPVGTTASVAYLQRKCRGCKSPALDYGSYQDSSRKDEEEVDE